MRITNEMENQVVEGDEDVNWRGASLVQFTLWDDNDWFFAIMEMKIKDKIRSLFHVGMAEGFCLCVLWIKIR